ncbi:MAG: deoxyribodipyrimidine photo-lyase [Kiritimatiellia bacterium]
MTASSPILLWFRNDLRLHDHPALTAAVESGAPVIPVYLYTPDADAPWEPGGASKWWLHHALTDLQDQLHKRGSTLILRSGSEPGVLLESLLKETGAEQIYWNRRYEPSQVELDSDLKKRFPAKSFRGSMLWEPGTVTTGSGDPYKVFTPFYKALQKQGDASEPLPAPKEIPAPEFFPASDALENWNLLPQIDWDTEFYDQWSPTEAGAHDQMETFLEEAAAEYKNERDFPAEKGTSRLSPYLHFGQISPRTVWHEAKARAAAEGGITGIEAYTRQLVWRDFAMQMLFHFPHTDLHPLQEKYADFPWLSDDAALTKWQRGQTGFPIVDAGMRELWTTGWMHNRVRMIVASFLVKDLLLPWQKGAEWFWDTLVDADLANNSFGWQWAGGCGADAAPYFRIFNPMLQSKKFDPSGTYLRRWIPEISDLSNDHIHEPWTAPSPPEDYPAPMVDHHAARDRALEALNSLK